MKNINKEIAMLAVMVMLLSGCGVTNTILEVGSNNRIMVSDSIASEGSNIKRIVSVPTNAKNKEALKYTLPGDEVKISGKNYDKNLVMDKAKVVFNADTIYARHQRELFENAKTRYFNGR